MDKEKGPNGTNMPEEIQLELLAPWYAQSTTESRTLDFFDAIPKYPFPVTTNSTRASYPSPVHFARQTIPRRNFTGTN